MQTVEREQLLSELASVKKGLAKKDIIEQSTSFIFQNNKVITYNDEIFAMNETSLNFEGVVEAEPLLKLLYKIKDDTIKIDVDKHDLHIKGKRFSSGIKFNPEIKIPISDIHLPKKMKKLPKDFTKQARLACLTASTSLNNPLLTCVHLYDNFIESCDNDRITICETKSKFNFDILIPAKNLFELCQEELSEIFVDDSWIHFKTKDGVFLLTRLYNEEFLDVQQFLPKEKGNKINIPEQLTEIISRADVFSKDIVSYEKTMHISTNKKKMEVSTKNDYGWFKEKTPIDFDRNVSFSINIEFMLDILKLTKEISIIDNIIFFETESSKHIIQLED